MREVIIVKLDCSNVIYAYKDKTKDKIVYVGQTVNLENRHKAHIKYDPFNENTREYNYPLSRGVRKYGAENYELIILEQDIDKDSLDEREKYWISFYDTYRNGFNQNTGGSNPTSWFVYDDEVLEKVFTLLKDETKSFVEILELTDISCTHLYNVNMGFRRKQAGINYPIRKFELTKGRVLTDDQIYQIRELLRDSVFTMQQISCMFGVSNGAISGINRGLIHKDNSISYPIRKERKGYAKSISYQIINEVIKDLNTLLPKNEIIKKHNISRKMYEDINSGEIGRNEELEYPLRSFGCCIPNIIVNAIKKDFELGISISNVSKKYNLSINTIKYLKKS